MRDERSVTVAIAIAVLIAVAGCNRAEKKGADATGTVPVRTKELVATLVSRINRCEY